MSVVINSVRSTTVWHVHMIAVSAVIKPGTGTGTTTVRTFSVADSNHQLQLQHFTKSTVWHDTDLSCLAIGSAQYHDAVGHCAPVAVKVMPYVAPGEVYQADREAATMKSVPTR